MTKVTWGRQDWVESHNRDGQILHGTAKDINCSGKCLRIFSICSSSEMKHGCQMVFCI